jgi:putative membrane protein
MNSLLLFLHLLALAVGGAASFGHPLIGAAMGRSPEARPALAGIGRALTMMGRGAVTVLIVTGVLLIWSKWGGAVWTIWFVLKLVAVAALLALMVYAPRIARRASQGDMAAAARIRTISPLGPVILAAVVLFAVLAFG